MKYAVEIGSGTMKFIPSFIKIVSGILKLEGGGDSETRGHHGNGIFKIRKVG
jgi:hypothetical protein